MKQAFNCHYEVIHLVERIDCPLPGCENVGEKGIKMYDNLVHMRHMHGAVFRAIQGPHRDDVDTAKKTGLDGTARSGPV